MRNQQRHAFATVFLFVAVAAVAQERPAPRKPALLFACPGENRYAYAGFDYMRELVKAGFEVDYCEGQEQLTWERLQKFNVVVIYDFPPCEGTNEYSLFATQPPWQGEYFAVVDRYVKAGGGVLVFYASQLGGAAPNPLLKQWGLQFPLIHLKDPTRTENLTNMSYPVAWTDQVSPSPVSEGVQQLWYPISPAYLGVMTMPILVDNAWQVVVHASKTAFTEVPKYGRDTFVPKEALIPAEAIKDPVLFAVREFAGGGRMAALQQWHMFSIGSGMKWLYNNEVLSRGLSGRQSDFGKLLTNTYRWLAEPSLKSGAVGGYVTDMNRLLEPQLRPGALEQLAEWVVKEDEVLQYHHPPKEGRIFKGVFGAESSFSGGAGSVADYAKVAREKGLDFLVFLEDFGKLTPEKLEALKVECKKQSNDALQLFAGYRMDCNTGNHIFFYGKDPRWPPLALQTGADKKLYNLQYQDETGKYAMGNPSLDWCLQQPGINNNVGYYDFSHSQQGPALHDLRAYSVAALRTYANGKLIDDVTEDYVTCAQGTIPPSPISLNLVRSPAELAKAIAANQALTYAQARSLPLVYDDALRWSHSYDGLNVFPSDGPVLKAWPKCVRIFTFGAEPFVTGRSLLPAPLHLTSEVGLKEVRLYNGQQLFRRFLCNGQKEFFAPLMLTGVVQRNLVLVAEDVKGGRAVSFALRNWKEGTMCPIFCGDHVNDCGWMLLAHGPHWPKLFRSPALPDPGGTWDGGPTGAKPLIHFQGTNPLAITNLGRQGDSLPNQTPLLEFSDEGATRCCMVATQVLVDKVPSINPWHSYGPLKPAPLFDAWAVYTEFAQYLTGVAPNAYGAIGEWAGVVPGLFTEAITAKKDFTCNALMLLRNWHVPPKDLDVLLVVGEGQRLVNVVDITDPQTETTYPLPTGGWFGLISRQTSNSHLILNRSGNAVLKVNRRDSGWWLSVWADVNNRPFSRGEVHEVEFFSLTWPLDMKVADANGFVKALAYLDNPEGLKVTRGKRGRTGGGLLELEPEDHAVEVSLPKPTDGMNLTVPVRTSGFNSRWSAGLYQVEGYRTHYYSKGNSGYRELGMDLEGRVYVPLFTGMSPMTHVLFGQPIVADKAGRDLFIQVTRLSDGDDRTPPSWHLSVNNPTDKPITTRLRRTMELVGLTFTQETLTFQPGEYRVLLEGQASKAQAAAAAGQK